MAQPPFEEIEFDLGGCVLRGRLYGKSNTNKTHCNTIIALHGWLDNCASFSLLAPKLVEKNCCVLALDLPGHGRSYHRHSLGAYNIWQDIPEILEIAEQLGWQRFGLVGHSRGAMIAALLAAVCPDKINFLGLIDGIVPLPINEDETLEQLRKAVEGALSIKSRPRTNYDSFADAVKAREKGFIALDHVDALALAERGVLQENGKFYWASDKKLLIPSEVKFTQTQIKDMLGNLQLDVQLVIGAQGLVSDFAFIIDWLKEYPKVHVHHLEGGHHLHMSQAVNRVASLFVKALPNLGAEQR